MCVRPCDREEDMWRGVDEMTVLDVLLVAKGGLTFTGSGAKRAGKYS